jgi:hypothetical protein
MEGPESVKGLKVKTGSGNSMNFNGPSCMPFSGIQLEFRTQEGIGYFLA